jgi:hypothetical protein
MKLTATITKQDKKQYLILIEEEEIDILVFSIANNILRDLENPSDVPLENKILLTTNYLNEDMQKRLIEIFKFFEYVKTQ